MNPYQPVLTHEESTRPGVIRRAFGWSLFVCIIPLAMVAFVLIGMCATFLAACEATIQSVVDGENWLEVYGKEFRVWV